MEDIARCLLRIPLDTVGGSPKDFTTLHEATDKMRLFSIVQTPILAVHYDDLYSWPKQHDGPSVVSSP